MKDYYKIMDIPFDASQVEVRTAYHSLAKKFHPDKNPDNAGAALSFIEIQEAYFVLSDEERRNHFHLHSKYPFTVRPKAAPETPDTILSKVRKLNRLLKEIDIFRMNTTVFFQAVHLLLAEQNISILTSGSNKLLNKKIIEEILQVCRIMSYREVLKISGKLLMIAGHDEPLQKIIYRFTNQKRIKGFWEQYNVVMIIFVTLIICLLILILSN